MNSSREFAPPWIWMLTLGAKPSYGGARKASVWHARPAGALGNAGGSIEYPLAASTKREAVSGPRAPERAVAARRSASVVEGRDFMRDPSSASPRGEVESGSPYAGGSSPVPPGAGPSGRSRGWGGCRRLEEAPDRPEAPLEVLHGGVGERDEGLEGGALRAPRGPVEPREVEGARPQVDEEEEELVAGAGAAEEPRGEGRRALRVDDRRVRHDRSLAQEEDRLPSDDPVPVLLGVLGGTEPHDLEPRLADPRSEPVRRDGGEVRLDLGEGPDALEVVGGPRAAAPLVDREDEEPRPGGAGHVDDRHRRGGSRRARAPYFRSPSLSSLGAITARQYPCSLFAR